MTLTKADLIDTIHKQVGFSKGKSSQLIESLLEIIKRRVESGEDVLISGFGKFCVKEKGKRRGRNPQSGEVLMLDARTVVTFRCSRRLRERNRGKSVCELR